MGLLQDAGVEVVHHYTPLHYLPFIARDRALLGKPSLASRGYDSSHLRSKSSHHDIARGFGDYAFLTIERHPRITRAKLNAGFPHVGIRVPAEAIEATTFDLCRFNVAMTRQLRRGDKPGWEESDTNGRYYGGHEIPVARTIKGKKALLRKHVGRNMIEVLIHGDLVLPDNTGVVVYSKTDQKLVAHVLSSLQTPWTVTLAPEEERYTARKEYLQKVSEFVCQALNDPNWRGNGLEFDKV